MYNNRVAEGAFFSDPLQFQGERVEARPQGLHEEKLLLLGQLEQRLELCCVGRGRLLAQDVLPSVQRVERIFVVQGMRGSCMRYMSGPTNPAVNDLLAYVYRVDVLSTSIIRYLEWKGRHT